MGMDEGFDMVPRLGPGAGDTLRWSLFMETIKAQYAGDDQVEIQEHYIEFKAGEHPTLPFHGPHFLRFSSKVTGRIASETGVHAYLQAVRRLAVQVFGTRIRPWSEVFEVDDFYDWRDVHQSIRDFQAGHTKLTAFGFANEHDNDDSPYPLRYMKDNLYEEVDIPDKGKGLVARCNIKRGTRILCEKPLFVVRNMDPGVLNGLVASKLQSLSKDQQMQFLSLHNNFPGKHAFAGIVRTNALPCGPGAVTGGIYPEICRINHSCHPNCHNSWNEAINDGQETVHAIRDIFAGEEITISYDKGGPSEIRQAQLKAAFGFDCKCDLCTLPAAELQASDERRHRIQSLDEQIGDPMTMMTRPLSSLHACRALLDTLHQEYTDPHTGEATATALLPRLYYDAMQIVVAHGDQSRARVFAERCYRARIECEGEDSPATQKDKGLMQEPSSHASFGACGMKWRTSKTTLPDRETVGEEAFEKWLWRL
ncbi:hypothetical protein PG993_013692 [Apiospora rasikravindrae]|uniref:SET domain-containing protein n=1 Tax=Apiospora rasikravindrae TaxID=990691 RepID=A0ABR1RQW8_9PEZI